MSRFRVIKLSTKCGTHPYLETSEHDQDGVHKWLVLVSAYVTVVVNVGFCYAIGSLFIVIMEEFHSTRARSAAMQSTLFAVFAGSGIVAGPLVKRYGPRTAGFIGSLCSSFGMMASYFASSITFLIVSIGIVSGFGFSLTYIGSTTATEKVFEGKRKLVILSLLVSGAGVGGMVYPYLLTYLNDMYGMNGTLLLVGAICGHTIPSTLLWGNDDATRTYTRRNSTVTDANVYSVCSDNADRPGERANTSRGTITMTRCTQSEIISDSSSAILGRRLDTHNVAVDELVEVGMTICVVKRRSGKVIVNIENNLVNKTCSTAESLTHSLTACESVVALLTNGTFVAFMVALSISLATFKVPFIFIVDIFEDKGYNETDANIGLLLINVLGIFGRLCLGSLVQIPRFPTIAAPVIASVVAALSLLGLTVLPTVAASLLSCVVLGLCHGMFAAMLTVVPVRLFGREHLPTASGLLFASNGIGNALVGPVSGMVRDETNSYNVSLYSAVGCLLAASVIFTVAHFLSREASRTDELTQSVFYITKF